MRAKMRDSIINNDEFNAKVSYVYKTKKDRALDDIFEIHTSPLDKWRFMTTLSNIDTMKEEIIKLYCPKRKL